MSSEYLNNILGVAEARNDKLREKLINVGERFIGFDKIIEEDAVRRKKITDQKYQEILETLSRLESTVELEVKRRVESNKTLQQMMEMASNDLYEKIYKKIFKKMNHLTSFLAELTLKIDVLEEYTRELKGDVPSKLQREMEDLKGQMASLQAIFSAEKKLYEDKSALIANRANEVEATGNRRIDADILVSNEQLEILRSSLEALYHTNTEDQDCFNGFALEELSSLKSAIDLCASVRDKSDEEIISSIHYYTTHLQKILRSSSHF